ncbi:DUF294 nucleotidyltransferase-like domain-containing protein [Cohnella sp. REN36]|uniref:DUF294 nucleotidyltransferase-like domain-containing protein n=1 Tax=Cohnella sp. REN36 TaxID=2887347 RepID=UPI001D13EAAB|nr:DUF294 nucleotidyltransferase-like domain-containing protein [Cohnella sp. REN36]MCC3376365.1 DUF294 nucleotidyltransferase-like domain-containing protein [Cohnella sp. REN36]
MSNLHGEKRLPDITGAGSLEQMRNVREAEQERLAASLSDASAIEVIDELNGLHDALMRKALAFAEAEAARLGHGAPPVPYAYLLFGSGGRREQTAASDQDSGIVYADADGPVEAERAETFFRIFGELAVRHLIALGYPPCEGNVIASNPEWRQSISAWERKLDAWFAEPSWENVRYLLIVADGRCLAGDRELADRLKRRFFGGLVSTPVLARRMMENTLRHKVLVGVFGQLLVEQYGRDAGSLDIKYGAYIPMVNVFRLLAMQADIRETGTLARIEALREAGQVSEETAREATEAFGLLLRLRLLSIARSEDGQWIGTGKIAAAQLDVALRAPLKKALRLGRKLQRQLEKEMQHRFGGR